MGNKTHSPKYQQKLTIKRESSFCGEVVEQERQSEVEVQKIGFNNDRHEERSHHNQEVLYLQNSNKSNRDSLNLNFEDLKHNIQEGTTIFSASSGIKYLVHCIKFSKEADYIKYTDTLIYRLQALRSCSKVKKQLNKIKGIYGQKIFTCSACNPCTTYKVIVIEQYFPISLQDIFQDPSKLSYQDIYNILYSFSKVMSAYQYKRLRFGAIDFSKIFVIDLPASSQQNYHHFSHQNKQTLKTNMLTRSNYNQYDKQQHNFICKVGDPYIRSYFQQQSAQNSKNKTLTDVYKADVLKIGHTLQEILVRKQMNRLLSQDSLNKEEVRLKQLMQKVVKNYMICEINNRFNWLQIQRYFQQLNTNQKSTRPVSMLQSINTQVHNSYQDSENRAKSTEKVTTRPPVICRIPDPLRSYSGRKQLFHNVSLNKENLDNSNYITLKPYKKSESKPNITLQTPALQTLPQLQPQAQIQPQPQLASKPYLPQQIPTTLNTIPQSSHMGPLPLPNISHVGSQDKNIFLQHSHNSGYGVVENTHPEYQIGLKIKYDNLYNIGKFWSKFEGNFVDGSKEGPGTIYLTTGHIFTGYFQKDVANGKGSVYINGQLVLKGTWKNNILITQF